MKRKLLSFAAAAALAVGLVAPVKAEPVKELNFGIISTESSQNLKGIWEPFLMEMSRKMGMPVKGFYASDYAGVIEAMKFNKVDAAWFGNKSAMEAVDRAGGEVFVQSVAADGSPGYWSLLVTHKDNTQLNTLQDVLKCDQSLKFGNGDPNSTSGFLVPSYYVFSQNNVDPKKCYKAVTNASHEANALAAANKQVDFATNNTENLDRLKKTNPEAANNLKVLWKSPLIPSDPLVWRTNLDASDKAKLKKFFLEYGTAKSEAGDNERKILAALAWAPFRDSSNAQLYPIRQLELFKSRNKIATDEKMSEADKKAKLAEIDAKLEELKVLMAAKK
ncbi:phosphonate/organophosphate ester transporter subunit; periplasmic binding component of ABC superfamily [Rhodospirillaceae bacterium LM-1]|nr:phosphonate/organophosphate ester transporter subunit; periplasmic binding component of ABC superfamily [Rhodospirillaceae bacterium LM-1]